MLKLLLKDAQGYREREFDQERVTIGRAADNTIVLDHPKVSRNHARIEKGPEGYRISDLGSGNGTIVNGTKVLSCILFRGDEIRIGDIEILVLAAGAPVPLPQLTTDRVDRGGPAAAAPAPPPSPPPVPPAPRARRTTGHVPRVTVGHVAREAASVVPHLLQKLIGVLLLIGVIGAAIYVAWQIRLRRSLEEEARFGQEGRERGAAAGRSETPGRARSEGRGEEVETLVREELRRGRYRRAEEILREHSAGGALEEARVSFLAALIRDAVEADFRQVEEEGRRLQERGLYGEAIRHYADCAGRFEGTEHHRYLSMKPAILEKLARVQGGATPGTPAASPGGDPSDATKERSAFEVLKDFVILKVREGASVEFAGGSDPETGSLARVARADDRQVWIDTGQLEQPLSWRQLGEAGLFQMGRSLVSSAPVPVQVAYLRLAVRLGRGRDPEVRALLAALGERSPAAAREFETSLGSPPEAPPKPPSGTPSPEAVPQPPAPKPPPENPPPPSEPPPPPLPPADPPGKAAGSPERGTPPLEPPPPRAEALPSPPPPRRTDRRQMPMNLVFAPHESLGEGDARRGNGAAGPVPGKGTLLAASGKVFVCAFAVGGESTARSLVLSAGGEAAAGIRTFTNPPVLVAPEEGAEDGACFQKPKVGAGVEDVEYRCGNTLFTVFACGGSSCLSILGVPPAHRDYNGTVRVGSRPSGVALSCGETGEKYAFAACAGDGTIAAVFLHEEGPLRRGDRMGETVYFDAATGKQIETRPASQQILDSDGRGGGQAGFSKIPGAPGPVSRAGQALGIEDVALLQRGPWSGGAVGEGGGAKEAYLFVSNTKAGSVSLFNAAPFLTGKSKDLILMGRIEDLPNPRKLLLAGGRHLWVGSHPGTTVFRIDLDGLPAWTPRRPEAVGVGKDPAFMAWLPTQGGFLMVVNSGSDSVSVVQGLREIGRLDAANSAPMAEPWGIWISGFGDRMIVTNRAESYATWWNFRLYPEAVRGPQDLLLGSGNVRTGPGVSAIDGDLRP